MKYRVRMYNKHGKAVSLGTVVANSSEEAMSKARSRNPGRVVEVVWDDGIPAIIDYSLPDPLPEVEFGGVTYDLELAMSGSV